MYTIPEWFIRGLIFSGLLSWQEYVVLDIDIANNLFLVDALFVSPTRSDVWILVGTLQVFSRFYAIKGTYGT
jgi:hypothetical protein